MPSEFEKFQELKYSGRYINPVTEANMPTTPPLKNKVLEEDRKTIKDALDKMRSAADDPIFTDPIMPSGKMRSRFVTILIIALVLIAGFFTYKMVTRDQAPKSVKELQTEAIDKIKAWANINQQIVSEFYNNNTIAGPRYLCVSEGSGKKCSIIGVRDVRPETDAGLELQ